MKFVYNKQVLFSLAVAFALVSGQPGLEPMPIVYSCPNQTVILTCSDKHVDFLEWIVEPYIPEVDGIVYNKRRDSGHWINTTDGIFYSQLTEISSNSDMTADITINTHIIVTGVHNMTVVVCRAGRGREELHSNTTIIISGVPHAMEAYIMYEVKTTCFTAVLKLGEMFDRGTGVPIDHYIIQVDNGTQLETTNSTYSLDIMYNTTLSVNISAHNCAGYSPFFPLVIQYRPDIQSNTAYTPALTTIHTPTRNNRNINTLEIALIVLGIYSIVVSVIACILPVYFIVGCFKKEWATVRTQNKVVSMEENKAYGVTVSGPDYNMEKNPLYEMRMESEESGHTVHSVPPVYETVDKDK